MHACIAEVGVVAREACTKGTDEKDSAGTRLLSMRNCLLHCLPTRGGGARRCYMHACIAEVGVVGREVCTKKTDEKDSLHCLPSDTWVQPGRITPPWSDQADGCPLEICLFYIQAPVYAREGGAG